MVKSIVSRLHDVQAIEERFLTDIHVYSFIFNRALLIHSIHSKKTGCSS